MMQSRISRPALIKRTLSSLAAIAAVSAIFGAKAVEIQHRAEAAETAVPMLAQAPLPSGS